MEPVHSTGTVPNSEIADHFGVSVGTVESWKDGSSAPPAHVAHVLRLIADSDTIGAEQNAASGAKADPHADDPLIRSKRRVADHGEVFTPPWLVEKMLDLVKGETERIDSRFLEPACGSGNFLVPILQRKLAAVEERYGRADFDKQQFALLAVMSCYGIELLADNVRECRANMLEVFTDYLGVGEDDHPTHAAAHVLAHNIIHGDAMTMRDVAGAPIVTVEWGYIGKGRFSRRDFRLDVLTGRADFQEAQPLFHHAAVRDAGDIASHDIFKPVRDYPPMRLRELAEQGVQT